MRSLSVGLTESQLKHLREIKKKYGISMGGFIRTLLKVDMKKALLPEYAIVDERSEVTKTRRRVMARARPVSLARAALMTELNAVLAKRKEKMEQAIVASAVRA